MPERKPVVLILDDDELALQLAKRELGESYRVISSRTVKEAEAVISGGKVELFIIEPAVDGGEGWALLGRLSKQEKGPGVVVCSVEDERRAGLEQGALAFLVKPVLPTTLHEYLDQILSRKKIGPYPRLEKIK
ncbi:MAG: response regulator [Anaerolineae bacterium]|nr:response regulator [Anaerolineae bacterium]